MLDISKNYWFNLESSVYVNIKEGKSLLYNTSDGSKIVIGSEVVNDLIKEINKDENYGSIFLDRQILSNNLVTSFIQEAIEKNIGVVVPIDYTTKKPINPLPLFRLDSDVERYLERGDEYTGKNILENLMVINLYVNSYCETNCEGCKTYFKQTTCCTVLQNESLLLSELQIEHILSQIRYSSVGRINILGGNVFNYPHLDLLISKISETGIETSIWAHYSHLEENLMSYDNVKLNIIVLPSILENELSRVISKISNNNEKYHFLVEKDSDVDAVEFFVSKHQIENYQLHPIFNGSNINFFEDNVYLDKNDIFQKTYSHREIFARKKLNINYFGVFNILPNGDVVADVNASVIGNVDTHTIIEMIHFELVQNTAWRKVRNLEPCSNCLYQFFCPSLSGYEQVIGKLNLCKVSD